MRSQALSQLSFPGSPLPPHASISLANGRVIPRGFLFFFIFVLLSRLRPPVPGSWVPGFWRDVSCPVYLCGSILAAISSPFLTHVCCRWPSPQPLSCGCYEALWVLRVILTWLPPGPHPPWSLLQSRLALGKVVSLSSMAPSQILR